MIPPIIHSIHFHFLVSSFILYSFLHYTTSLAPSSTLPLPLSPPSPPLPLPLPLSPYPTSIHHSSSFSILIDKSALFFSTILLAPSYTSSLLFSVIFSSLLFSPSYFLTLLYCYIHNFLFFVYYRSMHSFVQSSLKNSDPRLPIKQ